MFVALIAGVGLACWAQWSTIGALHGRIDQLSIPEVEISRMRAEHRRLQEAQIAAGELDQLRVKHESVERLRAEVENLKRQLTRPTAGNQTSDDTEAGLAAATVAAMAPYTLPENGWKNAGRGTPGATIETVLCAATEGDLDMLAAALRLEGGAREKAEAMLVRLPASTRAQYGTPERLVALFTANDLPIGVKVGGIDGGRAAVEMILRLETAEGGLKETNIALRREGDGWRLIVPESAIEKYSALLAGKTTLTDGK